MNLESIRWTHVINGEFSPKQIDKMLENRNWRIRADCVKYQKLSVEQIDKIIKTEKYNYIYVLCISKTNRKGDVG